MRKSILALFAVVTLLALTSPAPAQHYNLMLDRIESPLPAYPQYGAQRQVAVVKGGRIYIGVAPAAKKKKRAEATAAIPTSAPMSKTVVSTEAAAKLGILTGARVSRLLSGCGDDHCVAYQATMMTLRLKAMRECLRDAPARRFLCGARIEEEDRLLLVRFGK